MVRDAGPGPRTATGCDNVNVVDAENKERPIRTTVVSLAADSGTGCSGTYKADSEKGTEKKHQELKDAKG